MKRHVISYVSTANPNLSKEDVADLLKQVNNFNNSHDITGVLLYAETNFFQLIEGEETEIKSLYSRINEDSRHHNIIKIVDKPNVRPPYDGYISEFVTENTQIDSSHMKTYLHHIDVLDPQAFKAVERIIKAIVGS